MIKFVYTNYYISLYVITLKASKKSIEFSVFPSIISVNLLLTGGCFHRNLTLQEILLKINLIFIFLTLMDIFPGFVSLKQKKKKKKKNEIR